MKNKVLLSVILFFSIVFSIVLIKSTPKAHAIYPISASIANLVPEGLSSIGVTGQWVSTMSKWLKENLDNMLLTAAKITALITVQTITQAIIGDGGGGVITDWNKYLYVSPQQRAMVQMNSFFNTVSRGRLSSLNYEGVGPNYDAYLVAQARMAISGQTFTTNIQNVVTNPKQMFSSGNMKGLMTYMQCANNVACYTLTSTAQYNLEFAKAQEIAKSEQSNGFLPVRKNGKITQPASIVSNALTQIDQLGTQVIMNTDTKSSQYAAMAQIAAGAGINIAARTLNYATASDEGKEAIRNKNDQFPFSLAYSLNGGVGVSAGGVTLNTGLASANGNLQLFNVCATGSASIDGEGNTYVMINGQKTTCPKNQNTTSVTGPSINITMPTITCTSSAACNDACSLLPGCTGTLQCSANKCVR